MTTQLLPTTMVGSYPRPAWFTNQLQGRDVLDAFKDIRHREACMFSVEQSPKSQCTRAPRGPLRSPQARIHNLVKFNESNVGENPQGCQHARFEIL